MTRVESTSRLDTLRNDTLPDNPIADLRQLLSDKDYMQVLALFATVNFSAGIVCKAILILTQKDPLSLLNPFDLLPIAFAQWGSTLPRIEAYEDQRRITQIDGQMHLMFPHHLRAFLILESPVTSQLTIAQYAALTLTQPSLGMNSRVCCFPTYLSGHVMEELILSKIANDYSISKGLTKITFKNKTKTQGGISLNGYDREELVSLLSSSILQFTDEKGLGKRLSYNSNLYKLHYFRCGGR